MHTHPSLQCGDRTRKWPSSAKLHMLHTFVSTFWCQLPTGQHRQVRRLRDYRQRKHERQHERQPQQRQNGITFNDDSDNHHHHHHHYNDTNNSNPYRGEVTCTAMRHCLVLAGVRLTSPELAAVDSAFRSTTRPEMFGWRDICRAAVDACNNTGTAMEKSTNQ